MCSKPNTAYVCFMINTNPVYVLGSESAVAEGKKKKRKTSHLIRVQQLMQLLY